MTSLDRWARIQALFKDAIELDPPQRAELLSRACEGDAEMRREVESLLAADREAGSFLERPAIAGFGADERDFDGMVGSRIGAYRIVREIGRGGMGAVYLAARTDDAYHKDVALKVLKRGMDSEFFITRFRQEREILARFEHPNIARLIDGGTTPDGLPYLVMEYVDGVPLDRYCAEHRLDVRRRLVLFLNVCSAVEYAHRRLVVHRDLKPAHALVTADGTPKLLDFGIAKLLDPAGADWDAARTAASITMLTPEYASPEQIRGEPATTATDVYALGVLLFRLLTGSRPYRLSGGGREELARAICEQEPARPSDAVSGAHVGESSAHSLRALRRRLRGDLDTIVLKAIRKEPERRYGSAEQLGADITRHLSGVPVLARPDTLTYRAGRFVSRHRAAVAAAALVIVTMVGGAVSTLMQARIARAERAKAEHHFNDVRALANTFIFEIHDAIVKLPGSTPARALIAKKALTYLDSLAEDAAGDAALQRELADGYLRLGDVQGNFFSANLGDTAGALASYRKALAIEQQILGTNPGDRAALRLEANTYRALGEVLWGTGDWTQALEVHRRALAIRERLASAPAADAEMRADVASSYVAIADVLHKIGRLDESVETYRRARAQFAALATGAAERRMRRAVAVTDYKLAGTLDMAGDAAAAIEILRGAVAESERLAAAEPSSAEAKRDVALMSSQFGELLLDNGDVHGGAAIQTRTTAIWQALSAADPTNAQARADLALAHARLGRALARSGNVAQALAAYRASIATFAAALAQGPADVETRLYSIVPHYGLGELLENRGDANAALASYVSALAIWNRLPDEQHTNPELKPVIARLYAKLASRSASDAANGRSRAQQIDGWRRARESFQRGLELWAEVRKAGVLARRDAAEPDRIASEIARCDAALAKLGAAP